MISESFARRIPLQPFVAYKRRIDRVVIFNSDFIELVSPDEILYAQAEGNYCAFVLCDGTRHLASRTLGSYQDSLAKFGFLRPHQSYMVNPQYVIRIRKSPYAVCLRDGMEIPVSRANRTSIVTELTTQHA